MELSRHASPRPEKKKEVDAAALQSPFARIPRLPLVAARDLLDLGFSEVHELAGRAPEVLFEKLRRLRPTTTPERLSYLRMAVHYAEHPDTPGSQLHPHLWQ